MVENFAKVDKKTNINNEKNCYHKHPRSEDNFASISCCKRNESLFTSNYYYYYCWQNIDDYVEKVWKNKHFGNKSFFFSPIIIYTKYYYIIKVAFICYNWRKLAFLYTLGIGRLPILHWKNFLHVIFFWILISIL